MSNANTRPLFSIVIPAYNVEAYLEKCILAIQDQTFSDYEILIINDGSKDRTGEIADNFARLDKRIRVVHKENEGVSPTRNRGVDDARGQYLFFVDSDDWLADNEVLEKLRKAIVSNQYPNIIVFNSLVRLQTEEQQIVDRLLTFAPEDKLHSSAAAYTFAAQEFPNYLWTQIYQVEFVRQTGLQFYGELYEDTLFNMQLYERAPYLYTLNEPLYIHIKRPNSLTTSKVTLRNLHLLVNMMSSLFQIYERGTIDRDLLSKRMLMEYESLQKIIIALRRQGVEVSTILSEIGKHGIFRFPLHNSTGILRKYGVHLFNRDRKRWITLVKLLFKMDVLEKKAKRYFRGNRL